MVYTDFLQAIILLCGFGILTKIALTGTNGLTGLRSAVPKNYFSFLGMSSYGSWSVISLILTLILSVIGGPALRQTMFSAKDEKCAKDSMATAFTIEVVFSMSIGIVGMYTYTLNPHLVSPDQTVPWLFQRYCFLG